MECQRFTRTVDSSGRIVCFSRPLGFGDRDESRFASRGPVELPTRPPYTIHLGNLPFDVTETDVEEFFSASKVRDRVRNL